MHRAPINVSVPRPHDSGPLTPAQPTSWTVPASQVRSSEPNLKHRYTIQGPAVLHTVRHRRWVMMMSVLHTSHRAAQARSMLLVDHMPGPVAAVQQSTMPGACQEMLPSSWQELWAVGSITH